MSENPMSDAQFITAAWATGAEGEPAIYLRREFDVAETPVSATLRVTALGVVEPHLNGSVVGDEVLAPGWNSYRHRLAVSTHDVTDQILIGRNAVGAVVGEGWAVGRLGWEGRRQHFAERPALWLELEVRYSDRNERIVSGPAFRVGTGGTGTNGIYDGEAFDARNEPDGWAAGGFDDSAWSPAEPVDWPSGTLFDQTAEPIRRVEELAPVAVRHTDDVGWVVDFGQVVSGRVRLTVTGQAGQTVTLRHCEILTPDGRPEFETNRAALATDTYTLRGGSAETWEPRFTFHGFRYVAVEGWPGELDPDALRAVVVHSDMRRTGWLETSDPLLNRLHDNTVWSMRGNFVGVPTDCPQRDERLGWTGDLHAFAPTAAFLYDVRGVLRSWLRDLAAEQRASGTVPWVVPDVLTHGSAPTALWSDVAVGLPWVLYEAYGDPEILEDCYESMAAFVRQVESLLDADGLWSSGFQFGDWLDPDAPADDPAGGKTDAHLVAAAYFCRTTRQMANTAHVLGRREDAKAFSALADRVLAAFRREYVTATGRVVNETVTAYALVIALGIVSDDQLGTAGHHLARLVADGDYRISTGFAGTPLVAHALSRSGHLDAAYRMLTETQCPSFLYPVTMGATTIWERWDSVRPDGTLNSTGMTSLNHYALGAVAHWMHRVIGGIEPAAPGYAKVRICPQPGGGLTWAEARHDTVHGLIEVSWKLDEDHLQLDAAIPDGVTADVTLPFLGQEISVEGGTHSWRYALPSTKDEAPGLTMDTPMEEIARIPAAQEAITAVFAKHFPDMPEHAAAPAPAGMSLATALDFVRGATPELAADLSRALQLVRTDPVATVGNVARPGGVG